MAELLTKAQKREIAAIVKRIERQAAVIGAARDALRDLRDDLEGKFEATDEAMQSLDYAIDRLSEFV